MACTMRGPRSRAGLIAYPVVAPRDRPMPQTRLPTRYGPRPAAGPDAETLFEKIAPTTKTSTKVPMTSLSKFATVLRIAGAVQNSGAHGSRAAVLHHERGEGIDPGAGIGDAAHRLEVRAQALRRHLHPHVPAACAVDEAQVGV